MAPRAVLVSVMVLAAVSCRAGGGREGDNHTERESADPASKRVELTAEQVTNAGVAFGVVEERPIGEHLEATAEIEPAPNRFAQLGARVAGRVIRVFVAEGDRVADEQTLAIPT